MHCKFLQHGYAISYNHVVKPCCAWKLTPEYMIANKVSDVDLSTWHQLEFVQTKIKDLAIGRWPEECGRCRDLEAQGRGDSMRLNGNSQYGHYTDADITLELRPGSTCNFACQTCWPEASSRVAQYQHQAGMIDIKNLDSYRIDDFDWLLPITDRIKDVVLLGGEPFYDRNCRRFLDWSRNHLKADIMMFTNGSMIDFDFLDTYAGQLTLIFSIDAVGRPAEYVRFGTEWDVVSQNYLHCRSLAKVKTRVNITTSVFNFAYLESLLAWLAEDWPDLVTFGVPNKPIFFDAAAIPSSEQQKLRASLDRTLRNLQKASIEKDQKINAMNAVKNIMNCIESRPFDVANNAEFSNYVHTMDRVKNIQIKDYCPEVAAYI